MEMIMLRGILVGVIMIISITWLRSEPNKKSKKSKKISIKDHETLLNNYETLLKEQKRNSDLLAAQRRELIRLEAITKQKDDEIEVLNSKMNNAPFILSKRNELIKRLEDEIKRLKFNIEFHKNHAPNKHTRAYSDVMWDLVHKLEKSEKELEQLNSGSNIMINQLKRENQMLRTQLANLKSRSNTTEDQIPLDLVKFAMTQAHPDKPNGSNERFIKYRGYYEKLKAKAN